jgi:hypothetical protein
MQQIKTSFKGRPFIVTISEDGVSVAPEGPDGGPDLFAGHSVWVDPFHMEEGVLLVHTYAENEDEPVTVRLTRNKITTPC